LKGRTNNAHNASNARKPTFSRPPERFRYCPKANAEQTTATLAKAKVKLERRLGKRRG
jgi:hypothetical protein